MAGSTESTGLSEARGRRPTNQLVGRMGQPSKGPITCLCLQLGQVLRVVLRFIYLQLKIGS